MNCAKLWRTVVTVTKADLFWDFIELVRETDP